MFEAIANFFKKLKKSEKQESSNSKTTAKERLHLVLMQDRANVSADFLELMKQEIIEVIKKYIEVEEKAIDVRLTNKVQEDGTTGSPFLYANIPILNIRNDMKKDNVETTSDVNKKEEKNENNKQEAVNSEDKKDSNEEIQEEKVETEKEKDKKENIEDNNKEEENLEDKEDGKEALEEQQEDVTNVKSEDEK